MGVLAALERQAIRSGSVLPTLEEADGTGALEAEGDEELDATDAGAALPGTPARLRASSASFARVGR